MKERYEAEEESWRKAKAGMEERDKWGREGRKTKSEGKVREEKDERRKRRRIWREEKYGRRGR